MEKMLERPVATGWLRLEDAPLDELGVVWSPELRRTDILGRVFAHGDGGRDVSSPALGYTFTLWHALPQPPA